MLKCAVLHYQWEAGADPSAEVRWHPSIFVALLKVFFPAKDSRRLNMLKRELYTTLAKRQAKEAGRELSPEKAPAQGRTRLTSQQEADEAGKQSSALGAANAAADAQTSLDGITDPQQVQDTLRT